MPTSDAQRRQRHGLWLAFGAVVAFSLTPPATRFVVHYLPADVVGPGRALLAAPFAALSLARSRAPRPRGRQWLSLAGVAGSVAVGFPWLLALALQHLPATHGAAVFALTPLATAFAATIRNGERPSAAFWWTGLLGGTGGVVYAWSAAPGALRADDLLLLAAVAVVAAGYAEGARLTRELGAGPVIAWAVVLAAPALLIPTGLAVARHDLQAPPVAWLAFIYIGVVSQWLAFYPWYRGLALAGVARASQLQLLIPFLAMAAAALLLGEPVTPAALGCALWVSVAVLLNRRMPVATRTAPAGCGIATELNTREVQRS